MILGWYAKSKQGLALWTYQQWRTVCDLTYLQSAEIAVPVRIPRRPLLTMMLKLLVLNRQ